MYNKLKFQLQSYFFKEIKAMQRGSRTQWSRFNERFLLNLHINFIS